MSTPTRWVAGATALALAGAALTIALIPAEAASANTPHADYHAGSDKAVFTVTGVEDSNCLVSTGGSTVYIKPGDRIDFSSALAGVALNGLDLQGGQITGLNVRAKLDGGTKKGGSTFTVRAGKTVKVRNLGTGTHTLAWSAESIGVQIPAKTIIKKVPVLGGLLKKIHKLIPAHGITIPLSSSQLKSGAKLSWTGKVFVTKNAARCTLSVQTPTTKISAGPIHATVPGQKITVPGATLPTKVSGVPNLNPTGKKSPSTGKSSSKAPQYKFTAPQLTVPEMVVPHGNNAAVYGGGSGYDLRSGQAGTDNGSSQQLAHGTSHASTSSGENTASSAGGRSTSGKSPATRTVGLASDQSNSSFAGQLPVVLAIAAVIVLALVAGTYARLYLLGRKR